MTRPWPGYSLKTVIKKSTAAWNPDEQNSIYFYWDNPPQDILDAGEPVWYRADPPTIPAGGVAQVAVRLRYVPDHADRHRGGGDLRRHGDHEHYGGRQRAPVGQHRLLGRPDEGVSPLAAQRRGRSDLGLDGWHERDRQHDDGRRPERQFRRLGRVPGQRRCRSSPTTCSRASMPTARRRRRRSGHGPTNSFTPRTAHLPSTANYTGADWIAEATDHGFNNVQMNLGDIGSYMGTSAGQAADAGPRLWLYHQGHDQAQSALIRTCGSSTTSRMPRKTTSRILIAARA